MSFNPYLFFSGDCAEAFAFYSDVFGVKAEVMTHADLLRERSRCREPNRRW